MRTHGTIATYVHGCRCTECRTACRDYARERRKLRAPSSRRRPNGVPSGEEDTSWMDAASCRPVPTWVFFPTEGRSTQEFAKSVCGGCEVRSACLAYAYETDQPDGIWGGLTFIERERAQERTG